MVSEEELKRKKPDMHTTAKSKFISGYEASRLSKRPFADWRNEDIRCERCGQLRKFREFRRNEEICIYCTD